MEKPTKNVRLQAVAFSHMVQDRPLDWPTPMAELMEDPSISDRVWRRLQYVFGLENPRELRPANTALTGSEREMLARFVEQATRLAKTSLIRANDTVSLRCAGPGEPVVVESKVSEPDVTTGFMVLLRQCYADNDEASFLKACKVIERRLDAAGQTECVATLRRWRDAHTRLKKQTLEELVQEQLIADKKMPAQWRTPDGRVETAIIRAPAAPSEMLQTVWYGDQIHWGKNRQALQALRADPVWATLWDIEARQSASDFAHFYAGFALLIESVLAVATTA